MIQLKNIYIFFQGEYKRKREFKPAQFNTKYLKDTGFYHEEHISGSSFNTKNICDSGMSYTQC